MELFYFLQKNPGDLKQVEKSSDVPKDHHYAILVYKTQSVFIPGDERSRTHPGHGYPEHTETFGTFEHYVTKDKVLWEKAVTYLVENNKTNMVFFEVNKLGTWKTSVNLE